MWVPEGPLVRGLTRGVRERVASSGCRAGSTPEGPLERGLEGGSLQAEGGEDCRGETSVDWCGSNSL